jgi:parallel beta-helix repeat protein
MIKYQLTNTRPPPVINPKITQLNSSPATFTGNFWDYGVDTNSNGRFDLLVIAVEINCTIESDYRLYLEISHKDIKFSETVSFSMLPGIRILNVSFETPPIHKQFFSSNKLLSLHISHLEIEYITPPGTYWLSDRFSYPYTTKSYSLSTLEIDPFPLDSNAFLSYIAAFDEWPGRGTKENPFIISGAIINSLNGNLEVINITLPFILCDWILSQGLTGISLKNVQNAVITSNDITDYNYGIRLKDCSSNIIERNLIHLNTMGIYLSNSEDNSIVWNTLRENRNYGILLRDDSNNNVIHHNNFFLNGQNRTQSQAYDDCVHNYWYDETTLEGNYWSDYNKSGSYLIAGSTGTTDPYPSIDPYRMSTMDSAFVSLLSRIGLFIIIFGLLIVIIILNKRLR